MPDSARSPSVRRGRGRGRERGGALLDEPGERPGGGRRVGGAERVVGGGELRGDLERDEHGPAGRRHACSSNGE